MSFLVFASGLLLALGGAYAIFFGYGIVAVERGWASVIAGAAALSGGVVTMALGLILHSLAGLRTVLESERSSIPLPDEVYLDPESDLEHPDARLDESFETGPAFGAHYSAHGSEDFTERAPSREAGPSAAQPLAAPSPVSSARAASAAPVTMEDIRRLVAEKVRARTEAASEPAAGVGAVSSASAGGDWRAPFGTAAESPAGPAEAERPVSEPWDWETSAEPERPPANATVPEPQAPPTPLEDGRAVIGRHKSEGTVYIMYADGTIDAQSEHGVLHFESMTDLKSFMDEQARGSG